MAADRVFLPQISVFSTSPSFDHGSPQYYCCFGFFHAKVIGILVFAVELVQLIALAVSLFLQSAHYSTTEWQSTSALLAVGLSMTYLLGTLLVIVMFFFGIRFDRSWCILPMFSRLAVLSVAVLFSPLLWSVTFAHCVGVAVWHAVLATIVFGVYRYVVDFESFQVRNGPFVDASPN